MNTGEYQNQVSKLPSLNKYKLENIFKVHLQGDQYFYNILKTVRFPAILDKSMYYSCLVSSITPLTNLSYVHYGNIDLWWLICMVNNIDDPVRFIPPGSVIDIIKPSKVDRVISNIKASLNT